MSTAKKTNGKARPVLAVFYNGKDQAIKTNRGKYARTMTRAAFDHMQMDDYKARKAEVFLSEGAATLYGVLRLKLNRGKVEVETVFMEDPTKQTAPQRKR
jgi:hypothetical protein